MIFKPILKKVKNYWSLNILIIIPVIGYITKIITFTFIKKRLG